MNYGQGTFTLATALDDATSADVARRRTVRLAGRKAGAMRRALGGSLVTAGERLLGTVEHPPGRARPSRI